MNAHHNTGAKCTSTRDDVIPVPSPTSSLPYTIDGFDVWFFSLPVAFVLSLGSALSLTPQVSMCVVWCVYMCVVWRHCGVACVHVCGVVSLVWCVYMCVCACIGVMCDQCVHIRRFFFKCVLTPHHTHVHTPHQ